MLCELRVTNMYEFQIISQSYSLLLWSACLTSQLQHKQYQSKWNRMMIIRINGKLNLDIVKQNKTNTSLHEYFSIFCCHFLLSAQTVIFKRKHSGMHNSFYSVKPAIPVHLLWWCMGFIGVFHNRVITHFNVLGQSSWSAIIMNNY